MVSGQRPEKEVRHDVDRDTGQRLKVRVEDGTKPVDMFSHSLVRSLSNVILC